MAYPDNAAEATKFEHILHPQLHFNSLYGVSG